MGSRGASSGVGRSSAGGSINNEPKLGMPVSSFQYNVEVAGRNYTIQASPWEKNGYKRIYIKDVSNPKRTNPLGFYNFKEKKFELSNSTNALSSNYTGEVEKRLIENITMKPDAQMVVVRV